MPDDLIVFIVIGFCAQIVDGALGMAYGVVSTSWAAKPTAAKSQNSDPIPRPLFDRRGPAPAQFV